MSETCPKCGTDEPGARINDYNGAPLHRWCYERLHPPEQAETLDDVVRLGHSDETLEAISEYVTPTVVAMIVQSFNRIRRRNWQRRCEP